MAVTNKKISRLLLPGCMLLVALFKVDAFLPLWKGNPSSRAAAFLMDKQSTTRRSQSQCFCSEPNQNKNGGEATDPSLPSSPVSPISTTTNNNNPPMISGVIAPLHYKGPYACLSLRFPHLTGTPTWDFVVDTGANVNSIHADLAEQFQLPRYDPPVAAADGAAADANSSSDKTSVATMAAGVGGTFDPGTVVVLGDCSLAGLPPAQAQWIFLKHLTAAALPHAGPPGSTIHTTGVTAGLLGSPFVASFAGVELDWYGTDGDPPTFGFYFGNELSPTVTNGMVRVPLQPVLHLWTLFIHIHGTPLCVLLDTGSPVTILTTRAADLVGIKPVPLDDDDDTTTKTENTNDRNLFSIIRRQKQGQKLLQQQQSIGDKVIHVGGVDGRSMKLQRSETPVEIHMGGISLGPRPVYIGNVAALSVLESLVEAEQTAQASPQNINPQHVPVAILGLDFLKRTYRIILSTNNGSTNDTSPGELWLEELDDSKPIYRPTPTSE